MHCRSSQRTAKKIGALSWLSKETRVDLCGSVALLMQSFPCPTVANLKTCSKVLKEAMLYKDLGIRIFIELDDGKIDRKPLYLMVKTIVSPIFDGKNHCFL